MVSCHQNYIRRFSVNKIIYYDMEVFSHDWLFVASLGNHVVKIHNNKKELNNFLKKYNEFWFVGYNNYHYDDLILADIINGNNPYFLSQIIINNGDKNVKNILPNFKSLDLMQDMQKENNSTRISLKKIMGNLGLSILESTVSFDIDRPLTQKELEETANYCLNDVLATKTLYQYRHRYFETKLTLIKEFDLPIEAIRLDENSLAALILNCKWYTEPRDYLVFDYCKQLDFNLIPNEVLDFYAEIESNYFNGKDYKKAIKKAGKKGKLKTSLLGVPTVYGMGGLHACTKSRMFVNNIMQIDVSSYYPTLMVNNRFYSRSFVKPKLYDSIYRRRMKLKETDRKRADAYKLILNKPTGCMRSNMIMKDFHNANNIIVNGQLILTQLVIELKKYIILLQINTDSITFKYNPKNYDKILEIINSFENRFNLDFDKDKIKFLYQKNVNNYFLIKENGEIKFKGQNFKNYENHDLIYLNNSQSIISKCLVEYYKNKTPIRETVMKCYENDEIIRFQLVTSYGSTYDKCFLEYKGQLVEQPQKINRVFAVKDTNYGNIYKCKKVNEKKTSKKAFKFNNEYYKKEKMPNSFNHNYIFNGDISKFDKTLLDLDYYIDICEKELK